jgi:hypothetical protein
MFMRSHHFVEIALATVSFFLFCSSTSAQVQDTTPPTLKGFTFGPMAAGGAPRPVLTAIWEVSEEALPGNGSSATWRLAYS